MKIFLLGYMGAGKSYLGKQLAASLQYDFIDLDEEIEKRQQAEISEIFKKRGELFFRKKEREMLNELVAAKNSAVISLGGGTPCYGDNMQLINSAENSVSIYLKLDVEALTERLFKEKSQRPMISHLNERDELEEFIRKHLFERGFYYNQGDLIIDCNAKPPQKIIEEIHLKL